MKLEFTLFSRGALGRLLGTVIAILDRSHIAVPRTIELRRKDLSREEVLKRAAESSGDTCFVRTDIGTISISWSYTPLSGGGLVTGQLDLEPTQAQAVEQLLNALCVSTGVTYGRCDLEHRLRRDAKAANGDTYSSARVFFDLYWYNYFGPEYRPVLQVDGEARRYVAAIEELDGGGMAVLARDRPDRPQDEAKLQGIVRRWPYFKKHNPRVVAPVEIDYSEVRGLSPGPPAEPIAIGSIVGLADEFLESVPLHSHRFNDWVSSKRLAPKNEEQFLRILRRHEAVIREDRSLLLGAIAAYGELVRSRMGGEWTKAKLLNRGEPVVAKRGRPWTARRVILEVLEGLEGATL